MDMTRAVSFIYKNWRGEIATRTVVPIDMTYEDNPHHNGPQWFLNAYDPERDGARRSFAIEDILTPIRHLTPVFNKPIAKEPA